MSRSPQLAVFSLPIMPPINPRNLSPPPPIFVLSACNHFCPHQPAQKSTTPPPLLLYRNLLTLHPHPLPYFLRRFKARTTLPFLGFSLLHASGRQLLLMLGGGNLGRVPVSNPLSFNQLKVIIIN